MIAAPDTVVTVIATGIGLTGSIVAPTVTAVATGVIEMGVAMTDWIVAPTVTLVAAGVIVRGIGLTHAIRLSAESHRRPS